jgi:hypothetical protein
MSSNDIVNLIIVLFIASTFLYATYRINKMDASKNSK